MGIPTPEPGLVLNYAYLWHDEHRAGLEEGRKDRPSAIVLCASRESDGATIVTVLPITHVAPIDPRTAVELPLPIKKHLGLDAARSWIVIAEGNEFVWPGYDLRKTPNTDAYEFGFLPPRFFNQLLGAFVAFHESGRGKTTPRS
jgi:hypothetical protein